MLSVDDIAEAEVSSPSPGSSRAPSPELKKLLASSFGAEFTLIDGSTGEVLEAAQGQPALDGDLQRELCRAVARRGQPEFIQEEDPFLVLALPLPAAEGACQVAVAPFVAREIQPHEDLSAAAAAVGMRPEEAGPWASRQPCWAPEVLLRIGRLVAAQCSANERVAELEEEAGHLSVHLANTYEEISLLYRLTQNLKISQSDEDLGRATLEWLEEVLPAKGLAIQLVPTTPQDDSLSHEIRREPVLLVHGECPVDNEAFTRLMKHLDPGAANRPTVANRAVTEQEEWPCPQVRQMIAVSLAEGENLFGWLAALNHVADAEFGTVEANLLNSVAAILGIHSGNIELYRQQSELMAGIVRALTSAIDAKDPYTRGHSDRVARVAVRLAEELGCDRKTLDMIYLSGLLHDIGKIGIDDSVLRKPGRLSEEEYEHIKRHVEIGHKILRDLGRLGEILPVILHHHESWDGRGYPHHLNAEAIPLAARIVAVADAFDAMGSDRPYRKGMPDEKIDEIFRSGAGRQWDPEAVAALFRARDAVRAICRQQGHTVEIDPGDCPTPTPTA